MRARTDTPQPYVHTHTYCVCGALLCSVDGNRGLKIRIVCTSRCQLVIPSAELETLTGLLELPRRPPDPLWWTNVALSRLLPIRQALTIDS